MRAMAKFCGDVGFADTQETAPGVWKDVIKERAYYGDVLRNVRKLENGAYLNDDLNTTNQISIVADPYACEHFSAIRYVKWMDAYWKVPTVEVQRPRLLLTLGGVYNGAKT